MNRMIGMLSLAVALAVAGCGGKSSSDAPDTSSPSASASPAPSDSGEAPAETSPTATTPSVSPASGPLIDGIQVSFHVPTGWQEDKGDPTSYRAFSCDRLAVSGELFETFSNNRWPNANPKSLDIEVASLIKSSSEHWHRLPNVTIAGLTFYHVVAPSDGGFSERYGSLLNKRNIDFDITWITVRTTPAQRRQLTDQILASLTVK